MTETTQYHIFGIATPADGCLFVDYIPHELTDHEQSLLHHIHQHPDRVLQNWEAAASPRPADVFEIECVNDEETAREAVEFWRAYFKYLGGSIIEVGHIHPPVE
ncbi:hypothetical protein [Pseudomonas mangiferae]|uniref:Uncharacterized protein n=1 Tax=Pseudomonas mangiferae TaxID=2593654 RepID=A0A553H4W5_9PSED|nr:hypothetical protein [Pseudomonas mangiferae]TRX76734.1 hypothetical protein FM069_01560 [Pseudomonas mangiferae]